MDTPYGSKSKLGKYLANMNRKSARAYRPRRDHNLEL